MRKKRAVIAYSIMLIPGFVLLLLFSIIPMSGIVIAFEKFVPAKGIWGSKWIGLENFRYMFSLPDSMDIFKNTLIIAVAKIIMQLVVPVLVALLINEIKSSAYRKTIQTIIYLPHFLSWVILGGIISNLFSLDGVINRIIVALGGTPTIFLASNTWFRPIVVITDTWKEFGFGTVIYLAAMTAIDESLYEAAEIDGATRMQRIWYVTVPAIVSTIVLMATLSLGNVLNAGFEQIFTLYNPLVYQTGDIIDTYVYRMGIENAQYGIATAVGLLKSIISMALIILSYYLAGRYANYRIF